MACDFDTTLQFALQMQLWSTVTKTTKDHKDLFWKPLVKPVMLKQERTASNRQLQYERQADTCNPYLRGTTCLWVLPVLIAEAEGQLQQGTRRTPHPAGA